MTFALLLIAALAGPLLLGMLSDKVGKPGRSIVLGFGIALPLLLAVGLWLAERLTAHDGNLFEPYTDGDLGILLALYVSPLLLPVSLGLAFLGRWLGGKLPRQTQ